MAGQGLSSRVTSCLPLATASLMHAWALHDADFMPFGLQSINTILHSW